MDLRGDSRGQSIQIGAVLLFGILLLLFTTYQAVLVPEQNRAVEFKQNLEIRDQFVDLRNAIVSAPGSTGTKSVSLQLGARYPSRLVALNPGPASGTLRTAGTTDPSTVVRLRNARADGETGDFWNGSTHSFRTGRLVYQPDYNVFAGAPTTVYENSVVVNEYRDGNRSATGQRLVEGRTIRLVTLNGTLSTTQSAATTVSPRALSVSPTTVAMSTTSSPPTERTSGLIYEYYEASSYDGVDMPAFDESNRVGTGQVDNFDISSGDFSEDFAFRFSGQIDIQTAGQYTFSTISDDGSRLYIDGTLVVDNDGAHPASPPGESGTVTLDEGYHDITVTYFERGGEQSLTVEWESSDAGITRQQIPDARLSNRGGGTTYGDPISVSVPTQFGNATWARLLDDEFTSNGGAVQSMQVDPNQPDYEYYEADYSSEFDMPDFASSNLVRTGSVDNFDISVRDRDSGFAFRFTRQIEVPTSGQYTFYTSSDDGSRLYVDGDLVVDNDGQHGIETQSGTVTLAEGSHDITVTFFEDDGGEALTVEWEGPGFSREVIPDSALSSDDSRELTFELEPEHTYQVQLARVGIGRNVERPGPAYITDVGGTEAGVPEGSDQRLVVEVRDRYNNPVSDVAVNATTRLAASSISPTTDTTDGDGQVVLTYRAPDDIDTQPVADSVNVSYDVDPATRTPFLANRSANLSLSLTVQNTDASGLISGSGSGYTVNWLDPSGQDGVTCTPDVNGTCQINASEAPTVELTMATNPTSVGSGVEYTTNGSAVGALNTTGGRTNENGRASVEFITRNEGGTRAFTSAGSGGDNVTVRVTDLPACNPYLAEDFESGSLPSGWTTTVVGGSAFDGGVSDVTSNSGDFSAYVSQGEGYVASPSLDTADCERVAVEFWLRKGDDAFSEDPDGNDELVVQFRESGGGWQTFNRTDPTDFADGRIFEVDDRITATDAMHSDFRIRWYLVDAEGTGLDFWHFDDVVLNGDP